MQSKIQNPKSKIEQEFAFADLIAPLTATTFFDKYWEKQPLLITGREPDYYANLFTMSEVGPLLFRGQPGEDLQLAKDHERLPPLQPFDPLKVRQLYHAGYSIVLNYVFRRHEKLSLFCRSLEDSFHCTVGANLYLTPRNSRGFKAHYDEHDVIVLQIDGTKKWYVFDHCTPLLPGKGYSKVLPAEYGQPLPEAQPPLQQEFWLKPGDCLYLPRGFVHMAHTGPDTHSLHLTFGVHSLSWGQLIASAFEALARHYEPWRHSVPPGFLHNGHAWEAGQEQAAGLAQVLFEQLDTTLNEALALNEAGFRQRPELLPDYRSLFDDSNTP
ncbi:MAG: cupin domain-containing protein [Chloroflexota bacterium]